MHSGTMFGPCLAGIIIALTCAAPAAAHRMAEEAKAEEAAAQQDRFAAVQIKSQALTGGIHMLTGQGGNIGVLTGPDGVFMIDDQYAPLSEKILAAVAKLDDGPLRYVANTHWHFDHTGGNENMAGAGAALVAHDNVRSRMAAGTLIEAYGRNVPPAPPRALPVITYSEDMTVYLNGQTIRLVHVPSAHTDGDTIIHFPDADVIHMGDTFFNGFYPFIDLSSGGNINGMIAAHDMVLAMAGPDTKIIPGHGPLADKAALARARAVLDTVRTRVMAEARKGKSLEEIKAMDLMADYNEAWAAFINGDQIVTFAFQSLMKKVSE
ncbi:MAG: MBL fold metallo-hydrolase [Alphaproteobacteria bacterium]